MVVDREEEYEVEEILNCRIRWKILEYLVKWRGYAQPDWMSVQSINELAVIDVFHSLHPDRLRPLMEDEQLARAGHSSIERG